MPTRQRVYRTEAVVLRRHDLGEADRLTTVFSPLYGKLRLVAKGVRKPRSRKAGHLEPFTRVDLMAARGRELDIITQAEAIDLYPQLQENLERVGQAALIIELLDRFTVDEREENRALYALLVSTLTELNSGAAEPTAVVLYFQLRLFDLAGYRPDLFRCVGCAQAVQPLGQFFSPREGGILCPSCGAKRKDVRRISLAALKVLRHYQRSSFRSAVSPKVRPEVQREITELIEDYLGHLLERRLNAPAFIEHVRQAMDHAPEPA